MCYSQTCVSCLFLGVAVLCVCVYMCYSQTCVSCAVPRCSGVMCVCLHVLPSKSQILHNKGSGLHPVLGLKRVMKAT